MIKLFLLLSTVGFYTLNLEKNTYTSFEKDWLGFEATGWKVNFYHDSTSENFLGAPIEGWIVFSKESNKLISKKFTVFNKDTEIDSALFINYVMSSNCNLDIFSSFSFRGRYYFISNCYSQCSDSSRNDCLLLVHQMEKFTGQTIFFHTSINKQDSKK